MDNHKIRKPAKRAYSTNPDLNEAIKEIRQGLGFEHEFNLIIFFASPIYNPQIIAAEFKNAFPSAKTVGCTTAGETFGGKLMKDSIVAMGFYKDIIKDFRIEVVDNIGEDIKINQAVQSFQFYFGKRNLQEDASKYIGIILSDGLSLKEEMLISRLNQLTEVEFIGGSAGDNWKMENTYLYYDGKVYQYAAILMIVEPTLGFKVIKTQSFAPIGKVAKVSQVDESKRCVKKIDNIPAGIFYAQQIGCSKDEIQKHFINYSIGIMIYNDAYVHDIRKVDKEYNLYLYSSIPMGAEIQVLQATNIVDSLRSVFVNKIEPLENISAIINFSCGSRLKKIERDGVNQEVSQLWQNLPMIGFATYGEYYISFLNQTVVFLILF